MNSSAPNTNPQAVGPFLPLSAVEQLIGLKKSKIYELLREKRFPAPIRFSARAVRWDEAKVRAWMAEQSGKAA